MDFLSESNAFFRNGKLEIDEAHANDSSLMEKLSGAILAVARFVKFTETIWMTVATSMRSLTAALSMGLQAWVVIVFADPCLWNYYILGAKRPRAEPWSHQCDGWHVFAVQYRT